MSDGSLAIQVPQTPQPLLRLLSDERLAKLVAQGSAPAFAVIYQRHHQDVYRYCRSIVRDEQDASDVLQNTMLKAMRSLEGETREIAMRPWLFRIAHNESISLIRGRSAERPIEAAVDQAAAEAGPETRERLRNLLADLDQLAPRQRGALVMRELNGLEFDEIAAALDTSPAAAKQAVYEARMSLHELEEGRELSCDEVRQKISAQDRRMLRARRVRGHLRSCVDCRDFAEATRDRRGQLAALAPPLPLPAALAILDGIIGGGGGAGGAAALAGGGGVAALAGSTFAKLGIAGLLVLGVGTVALEQGSPEIAPANPLAPSGQASGGEDSADPKSSDPATAAAVRGDSPDQRSGGGDRGGGDGGSEGAPRGSNGNDHGAGGQSAPAAPSAGGSDPPGAAGTGVASAGSSSGGSSSTGGGSVTGGGSTSGGSSGGSSGTPGPASTPPGHGGTPPGQGGVPPGLGTAPPGHDSAPGPVGTPPGQGATPHGHGGAPPGLGNAPAGLGG